MAQAGWKRLLEGWPWFRAKGAYPLCTYPEFLPPVRLFRKPYGSWDPVRLDEGDPWGWPVTEYEEALTIRPGLRDVARRIIDKLVRFARGDASEEDSAAYDLSDNPYWTKGMRIIPKHERFVLLLPLALSQTHDDKARVTWTVYGASEQGPARSFWTSFFAAPGVERHEAEGLDFFRRLLHGAYGEPESATRDLLAAGFRILPQECGHRFLFPAGEPLPSWTARYLWSDGASLRGVKYLLTFRPYRTLPANVRRAYGAGRLHLLPYPGSLVFWGVAGYGKLQRRLPFALQIPLLQMLERQVGIDGLRVPQAGWFEEPVDGASATDKHRGGPLKETYRSTHRQSYVYRDENDLPAAREHWLVDALFSTNPEDVDLYQKPLARNAQLWDSDFRVMLDGPNAGAAAIRRVARKVEAGGLYGYRIISPGMQVGRHEVYWHRPLVAYRTESGRVSTLVDGPTGYLTAYPSERPDLSNPVELWPRLLQRKHHVANVELFESKSEEWRQQTLDNICKWLECWEMTGGRPLSRSFARQLLTLEKHKTLEAWLRSLPKKSKDPERGKQFAGALRRLLEADRPVELPDALTFQYTASRAFEIAYWEAIADLSTGAFLNTNNADCVNDEATRAVRQHRRRDLEPLGDYLLNCHQRAVADNEMMGRALVGELPFRWESAFEFPWMSGWNDNQDGTTHERNLMVIIPGRDRGQAVVMADHYDTAYMEDYYEKKQGGFGARVAAPGANDNCSATATLLQAAPIFLQLSRAGRLGCDVWLLHLTGEEYPAAGLGACHFCRQLIEGTLRLQLPNGKWHDLSGTRVKGLIVMDMIAHNTNKDRYVFQIAPGSGREALWLAEQAHQASLIWNASADTWNQSRRAAGRGRRRRHGRVVPELSRHPYMHGEIRLEYDPRSTLFNTDGQVFSDNGVPVVLFMENYDIERSGYHDSKDTLANINLDYGAALAAIAIEAAARAATIEPPSGGATHSTSAFC
jgi:hypothetical protein